MSSFFAKRKFAEAGTSKTVFGKTNDRLFEWAAGLATVLLFYNVLLFVMSLWPIMTVDHIRALECWLSNTQKFVSSHKISWRVSMAVLLGFYLSSRLWSQLIERETPFKIFKKIKTWVRVVNIVLFWLVAFTVLGSYLGEAAITLEVQLRKERKEYGDLRREAKNALAGAFVIKVYRRELLQLPNSIKMSNLMGDLDSRRKELERSYKESTDTYGFREDPKIESLLRIGAQAQAEPSENTWEKNPRADPPNPDESEQPPASMTYEDILEAQGGVRDFESKLRTTVLVFVAKPGGKDIATDLPDGAIEHLYESLKPLVDEYPFLKPLADLLTSTVSNAIKAGIEKTIARLSDSALRNPASTDADLTKAADDLANSIHVTVPADAERAFDAPIRKTSDAISEIASASEDLRQRIKIEQQRIKAERERIKVEQAQEGLIQPQTEDSLHAVYGRHIICICVQTRNRITTRTRISPGASCGFETCPRDESPER